MPQPTEVAATWQMTDPITFETAGFDLIAALPNGEVLRLPMDLDDAELLALVDQFEALEDKTEWNQVRSILGLLPDRVAAAATGVPSVWRAVVLQKYLEKAIEPMGKVLS